MDERREGHRQPTKVCLPVTVGGRTWSARLYDLSPSGCLIDSSEWWIGKGDKIVVEFSAEISVAGEVAWERRGMAGIKFDQGLPESLAGHLRQRQSAA